MCSMCHYCGAGLMGSNVDEKKQDHESSLKLNSKVPTKPCKFCGEKLERENMKLNGTSPFATPHISPTSSLSSSGSCVSTCSDFSVDVNSFDRMSREESTVSGAREDLHKLNGELQKGMENNSQESSNDNEGYIVRNVEIEQGHNCQEPKLDGSENPDASSAEEIEYSLPNDLDIQTWEPPEPENPEDDMDNSVTYNDEDEDEDNWGDPTTYIFSSKDEVSEEKQRAMENSRHLWASFLNLLDFPPLMKLIRVGWKIKKK